ncbi:MAG: GNAT family N-acetyltransferase [Devosia sp.]|nr:GNAT family N-acetyltransferase [Devosia sp.]
MPNQTFRIQTTLSKDCEFPEVLNFTVGCTADLDDSEGPIVPSPTGVEAIGRLSGFLVDQGYLPDENQEGYAEIFDARSGHADQAYRLLVTKRALIGNALPGSRLLETGSAVAHLERVWVHRQHRGQGLALRLMREARHLFGRYGLLVMLRAYPDGDEVDTDQVLRLADYYASDRSLGLEHLSRKQLPGWLVAHWEAPEAADGDGLCWQAAG